MRRLMLVLTAVSLSACRTPSAEQKPEGTSETRRDAEPEIANEPTVPPAPAPRSDALTDGDPPPPSAPERDVVLAKLPGDPPRLLRAGTPTTIAAIEAALPGLSVKRRRLYGVDIHRRSKKVATVLEELGKPFHRITLLGPGLADPHGVEVGASVSALAKIPKLGCAIDGDEDWGVYVVCMTGERPQIRYVFVRELDSERLGEELTLAEAERELGKTRLTAIEIAVW